MRALKRAVSTAERWFIPDELGDPLSAGYLRARIVLALTVIWVGICGWTLGYQLYRGVWGFAAIALATLVLAVTAPFLMRRTRSLVAAGNVITCAPFLGFTAANLVSGGQAVASVIALSFVPLSAALIAGRRSAFGWAALVVVQLIALPWFRAFGLEPLIEPNPEAAAAAMYRAPLLGVLILLAGIYAYEAVTERAFRIGDLTKRLQGTEQRLMQLAETTPDAICITRAGRVRYANPALLTLLHVERFEGLQDRPFLDFVHPEDRAALAGLDASSAGRVTAEVRLLRADGGECSVELALTGVPRGESREDLYLVHDLTQRKLLEEQVRQSQKMEAVGQLAGGIAHDFNNLLTVILGEIETLLFDPDLASRTESRRGLESIRSASERSAALTQKLLAFSRRQILRPQLLDLNEIVNGMIDMLRRLVPATIHLETELAAEVLPIKADPVQLEQVILNVVLNARGAGARRIVLATATGLGPSGRDVQLSVADDGEGMEPATLERAFEPFFTTKAPGTGTGLGLATVHGIVLQSGGRVELESAPGEGTCLRIRLPAEEDAPRARPARGNHPPAALQGGAECVLLVEDEPSVRRVSARLLRRAGYQVLEAGDGREALEVLAAEERGIDLLLSDLVMPHMGGVELATRLCGRMPGLPVLFISGYGGDETRSGAAAQHPMLGKPFSGAELVSEVRRRLDAAKHRTRDERPARRASPLPAAPPNA